MLPKFLTRPGNLKVGVGQNARFDCKVEAEPGFKIIWQKTVGAHSVLLIRDQLPSRRITVGYDDSLSIKNVQKKDEASYVCTVISELKTASATARLTVVGTLVVWPLMLFHERRLSPVVYCLVGLCQPVRDFEGHCPPPLSSKCWKTTSLKQICNCLYVNL